eukprot:COSAG04_NODE_2713_length_3695_cov_36.053949_2_plen_128_part_00
MPPAVRSLTTSPIDRPFERLWPLRYARTEGRSLNVYGRPDDRKARGSSIKDVTGCAVERGTESWLLQGDKPKLVLKRADLQGGGESSFCFATVELRDDFYVPRVGQPERGPRVECGSRRGASSSSDA